MADRRRPSDDEAVTPAELTRKTPDNEEDGAGPGAPETIEPTQGREGGSGPGGPAMKGLGDDEAKDEGPS